MVTGRTRRSLALDGVAVLGGIAIIFIPDLLRLGHAPGQGATMDLHMLAVLASFAWASAWRGAQRRLLERNS